MTADEVESAEKPRLASKEGRGKRFGMRLDSKSDKSHQLEAIFISVGNQGEEMWQTHNLAHNSPEDEGT